MLYYWYMLIQTWRYNILDSTPIVYCVVITLMTMYHYHWSWCILLCAIDHILLFILVGVQEQVQINHMSITPTFCNEHQTCITLNLRFFTENRLDCTHGLVTLEESELLFSAVLLLLLLLNWKMLRGPSNDVTSKSILADVLNDWIKLDKR